MTHVWPFAAMRVGEVLEYDIPVRSSARQLFRYAIYRVRKRKGYQFHITYTGKHIRVKRLRSDICDPLRNS